MSISECKLPQANYSIKISDAVEHFDNDWRVLSHNNIYADPEYLTLLEKFGPDKYNYAYAVLYENKIAIAAFYFQMKKIELAKDFRVHTHSNNILKKLSVKLQKLFFKLINQNLLICGNVLLTGEYAFGTDRNHKLTSELINDVFDKVKLFFKNEKGIKIQSILCKDFFEEGIHKELNFDVKGFTEFRVQPDMILAIRENWKSFDDFLSEVRSKYRVKFKKVISQAKSLEFKELDISDLEYYNSKMYALYEATAKRASFSLFHLHSEYFLELKKTLKDNIIITGIFQDAELLGFYTFVRNNDHGDAHFIGYDVKLNSKYQIYFNILLGLIVQAINAKSKYLNLSRTALEIKSSVGAEPHEMFIYLKHENSIINWLLPHVLERVVPKNNWEVRSPFK